jgi:FkbM family methyltransferase
MIARLRCLWTSDLELASKLRYLADVIFFNRGCMARATGVREYRLKGGVRIALRNATTDSKVFDEVFLDRVYAPYAAIVPGGSKILDLGANIGLSAIFLARAAPGAKLIAVEPDGGNFQMLVVNLRAAGLGHRAIAVQAFAGAQRGFAGMVDSKNGEWGIRMGPKAARGVPVIPICDLAASEETVVVKCDIEGSEKELFFCLRDWEHRVSLMILELHTELFPLREFYSALDRSAYDWTIHGEVRAEACISLIAIERKERKRNETSAVLATLYGESP